MIKIHLDFSTGEEISYLEGKRKLTDFSTHCLQFFNEATHDDVVVLRKDGRYILKSELMVGDSFYTDKEIRGAHNITKMLIAAAFKFKPSKGDDYVW